MKEGVKMAVTDKIKALLSIKGKKNVELAAYLGISPQSLQNKFTRGSFSAEDLIKVSDFLGCTLAFEILRFTENYLRNIRYTRLMPVTIK